MSLPLLSRDRELAGHGTRMLLCSKNVSTVMIVTPPMVSVLAVAVSVNVPLPGDVRSATSVPEPDSSHGERLKPNRLRDEVAKLAKLAAMPVKELVPWAPLNVLPG